MYVFLAVRDVVDAYRVAAKRLRNCGAKEAPDLRRLGMDVSDLVQMSSNAFGAGVLMEAVLNLTTITMSVFFAAGMVENILAAAGMTTTAMEQQSTRFSNPFQICPNHSHRRQTSKSVTALSAWDPATFSWPST